MIIEITVICLAIVGAFSLAFLIGPPLAAWLSRTARRLLPRVLPITVCPQCRRWSSNRCNRTDWYGDGHDCRKDEFVRMNRDGSLRKI